MRILFWSETFWPRVGGVENLAVKLLPALRARGHDFAVITWEIIDAPDEIQYQAIPIFRFPFFSGGRQGSLEPMMENVRHVAKVKRDFSPDLVHINSYGRSVLFHLLTAKTYPAPLLLTLHQALPDEPVGRDTLLGKILRMADWVTACSASVVSHTRELVPEITPCSTLIHNGLDAPTFHPQPISFDPPRLLCLGRLVAEKGFDLALEAFATVLDRFPNARLVIGGDGPEREKLQQQAITLGLVDSVEFAGRIPPEEVAHFIDEATLVLIPSRSEGFGLVALEAALMARPVVAARVGGLPEIVLHQKTGLLVEHEDHEDLAEAITLLLNHPRTAAMFGEAARWRAKEIFSFERYVAAYDDLYQSITRKAPRVDDVRF